MPIVCVGDLTAAHQVSVSCPQCRTLRVIEGVDRMLIGRFEACRRVVDLPWRCRTHRVPANRVRVSRLVAYRNLVDEDEGPSSRAAASGSSLEGERRG